MNLLARMAVAMSAVMLTLTPAASQNRVRDNLQIATDGTYAPWGFVEAGKLTGYDVELANHLCERLKVRCALLNQDFDGLIPGLNAGKFDVIMASMNSTAKRREVMDFSRPYAIDRAAFFVASTGPLANLPGAGVEVNFSKDDPAQKALVETLRTQLKGRTVGVQGATNYAAMMTEYLKGSAEVREYKSGDQAALDLTAGRIDAILAGQTYFKTLEGKPEFKTYKTVGATFFGGVLGDGISAGFRKNDAELRTAFDQALAAAIADGTVSKLAVKWLGADITPK